jgi:exodeoxyribonuclease VII small subunit
VAAMKSFEERLARLEELNGRLKDGQVSLEEAIGLFEEGVKLARTLEKDLSRIERKVEILTGEPGKEEGAPTLELFPELAEGDGGKD